MKKISLALGLALTSAFAVNAQDNSFDAGAPQEGHRGHGKHDHPYGLMKPTCGDFTAEFGLNGGINNTMFKANENANKNDNGGLLRFRYFVTDQNAVRLGFNFTTDHTGNKTSISGNSDAKVTVNNNQYFLNLGIEHHFEGTARLSPYVGGDLILGLGTGSTKYSNVLSDGTTYQNGYEQKDKTGTAFSIGARGVIGADYYVAKHLFLGAEGGFGFLYSKTGKGSTTINGTKTDGNTSSSEFGFNPNVVGAIRIGFVF